jgi:hypothetical protein
MKQYRITSENITPISDDDCYLSPDDPIHELKIASMLGGLGSEERLAEYKRKNHKYSNPIKSKAQIAREQNIQPGTDAWFKLFFAK